MEVEESKLIFLARELVDVYDSIILSYKLYSKMEIPYSELFDVNFTYSLRVSCVMIFNLSGRYNDKLATKPTFNEFLSVKITCAS